MTVTASASTDRPDLADLADLAGTSERGIAAFLVFCPVCRRLQPPARAGCAGCGARAEDLRRFSGDLAMLAPGRVSQVVRYPGDTRFITTTALAGAALFGLAVALSGQPASAVILMVLFAGVATVAFVDARRAARLASRVRQVPPPPAAALATAAPGDRAIAGVAQPLERFVDAPLARRDCLAVRLDIRAGVRSAPPRTGRTVVEEPGAHQDGRDIVAQWIDAAELVVTTARGARTLVTGVIYLDADEYDLTESSDRMELELRGQAVGPAPLGGDGWACELALAPGDRVEICGHSTGEVRTVPVGALYRDTGTLAVMRGEPGDPVIVRVRRR
jgi:hypothetical protein